MRRTAASARKATLEITADNLFVRMAVSTEADAWLPTDVFALTASPALSARETTALDRASPQSTTRCVRASSQVLCAQRRCAVRQWAERGVTPVRCAQLSRIPVGEASSQTTAQGHAKMWMSARPSLVFVKEETVSTLWDPLNVNVPLGTSSTRSRRNVKIWMSVLTYRASVVWVNAPIPLAATSASVLRDITPR